jgi:hypothetical protein
MTLKLSISMKSKEYGDDPAVALSGIQRLLQSIEKQNVVRQVGQGDVRSPRTPKCPSGPSRTNIPRSGEYGLDVALQEG